MFVTNRIWKSQKFESIELQNGLINQHINFQELNKEFLDNFIKTRQSYKFEIHLLNADIKKIIYECRTEKRKCYYAPMLVTFV